MKLLRFGDTGEERPGIQIKNSVFDVSSFGEDYSESFFESNGIERLTLWLETNLEKLVPLNNGFRYGCPIKKPSKIICIGLNYKKHALEAGMEVPEEPIIFMKSTSAISGPNDPVILPKKSTKSDWEVELGVVIGKKAKYVEEQNAMNYVVGYLIHNDYSERSFQLERGGQWVKGKSFDNFAPLGPYLVTKDEIENPHNLNLWLKLNGKTVQNSNTSDLIFNIPKLISYLSQFMTLLPGDIISTGTPSGVGMGMNPPRFLKSGDVVELGIDGLGSSKQLIKSYPPIN